MRVLGPASGVLVAVLLAGCGGAEESASRDEASEPPAQQAALEPETETVPETQAPEPVEEAAPLPSADVARQRKRAVRRVTLRMRKEAARDERAASRRAALAVARAAGLSDVELERRTVSGAAPCGTSAAAVQRRVRDVLKGARVQLRTDCALEPPAGRGRVVLEQSGRGAGATREVELPAGRWAVEYAALGKVLQIAVEREGDLLRPVIRASGELSGRRVYREDGFVRLHVAGDGRWVVRIRRLSP